MSSGVFALLVSGAALLGGAAPPGGIPSPPEFVAIARAQSGAWLLEGSSGYLWRQTGEDPPAQQVRLRRKSSGLLWSDVTGFAAVQDGWLIAGRKGRLERYSTAGEFLRDADAPGEIGDVVRSGSMVWALPLIAPGPARHLLLSPDGERFSYVLLQAHTEDVIGTGITGVFDSAVHVTADRDEGAALVRFVGGPVAFRIRLDGSRRTVQLAYRRSARRDAMRRFEATQTDLQSYSSPARDLLVLPDGSLLVLRNREDVRTSKGLETRVGTVVDLYSQDGRHGASAELPHSARFIVHSEGQRVVCVAADGRVLASDLGPPIAGGIQ